MASFERRAMVRPETADDVAGLVEHVHSLADARERDPVLLVLELVPGGPEAELEPPARDVVDRRRLVRDDGGMPVRDAEDDHAATQPSRAGSHRGEERHPLEARPLRVALDRQEVVEDRSPVEAEVLRRLPERDVAREVGVLLAGMDAEPERLGHHVTLSLQGLSPSFGAGDERRSGRPPVASRRDLQLVRPAAR